jgi:hypothetical protein
MLRETAHTKQVLFRQGTLLRLVQREAEFGEHCGVQLELLLERLRE